MRALSTLASLSLLCVAAPLGAQGQLVSPAFFAARDGNVAHDMLGARADYRYQQSHGDLQGQALLLKALAWRRDGAADAYVTAVARTLDAELVMSDGPGAAFATDFAANYASPPQVAVLRKSIALPDLRQTQGPSAPFAVTFAFDAPFAHGLGKDVLWELRVFQSTATGQYVCDAYQDADGYELPNERSGIGCLAHGKTLPLAATAALRTERAAQQVVGELRAANLPVPGWGIWILGAAPATLVVPGFCAPVLVRPDLALAAIGNPGYFALQIGPAPFAPALVGQKLFAQMLVGGESPVLVTDAVAATIAPPLPPAVPLARIYAPTVTATQGFGLETSGGVIVRFSY